jgi:putative ABC transport system permease protein
MFKNYLRVALRNLIRYKEYTAINIFGLAVGIACCLLIMLFVRSELSYDRFHSKSGRIFRVWQEEKEEGHDFLNVVTPLPMASAMQNFFPEIESACRVYDFNQSVKSGDHSFIENINMIDPGFFEIFDFQLLTGNKNNPFPTANSILLTPATARKFFGITNAVGKNIEMQLGDHEQLFTVAGIVQKSPEESSIKFDILLPFDNAKYLFREGAFHSWRNIFTETYLLLRQKVRPADLEKKFPVLIRRQFGPNFKEESYRAFLQPIRDIHLNVSLPEGNLPISNPKYSYILSTIGILILLLACVNFITLSVGRSSKRAMEVGVRKVLGAERRQIIRQFWGEAFLLTLISVVIGWALAASLIGPFNLLTEKQLNFQFDLTFLVFCLVLIALVAMTAGFYPAIILSGFNPIEVLKGKLKLGNGARIFRQSLVVGQFVIAISMISCTFLVGRQMKYLQEKDLGYSKEQLVIVPLNKKIAEGFDFAKLYKTELLKHPEVEAITTSVFSFAETPWVTLGYTDDQKTYRNLQFNVIDPDFLNALKIPLLRGRNFAPDNTADKYGSIIVNESLVKEYGWKDPIGKKLPGHYEERIIGVTKDFNYESLHTKVKPLVLALSPDSIFKYSEDISFSNSPQPRVSVRMKAGSPSANIEVLKKAWLAVAPGQEFEFHFLDAVISDQYKQEQRTAAIIKLSSALAVFIACMGLFGLATLTVIRRTKEIGVRKVLGASIAEIIRLLFKDFLMPVVLATIIAAPISWWAMNSWLDSFAYRTPISVWIFLAAALIALLISGITVSVQSVRAATGNPVKSIRTE